MAKDKGDKGGVKVIGGIKPSHLKKMSKGGKRKSRHKR